MFLRKAQLIIIIASMVLIPLVYWHGVFFPYTFIKTLVFYALTEVVFALWVALAIAQKEFRVRWSLGIGAMALFLIFMGIALAMGADASKSIWSDYERMFGFITWAHAAVFVCILSQVVRQQQEWDWIFKINVSVAAGVAAYAAWQWFTAPDLSISTVGNAAYLSSYLIPMFFITCMLVFSKERFTKSVWLYAAVLFLFLIALVGTQARAGVVGLAGGLGIGALLFLFFAPAQGFTLSLSHRLLKRFVAAVCALGILAVVLIAVFPERATTFLPSQLGQLIDFNIQERTASGRILVWQVAWEGWKEKLLFGWGPEHFSILFNTYYKPELYMVEPWFDRAHNFIFDYGSTMGIGGLVAYVGMFGAACWMAARKWRQGALPFWHMAMIYSLVGAHLIQNLFTFDTISSLMVLLVVFGYSNARNGAYTAETRSSHLIGASVVAVLVVGMGGYFFVARPYLANASAHQGWELLRTGGGDDAAIAQFEKSISYGTPYSVDARRFMAEYVFEFLKQGGKRPPESLRMLMNYAIKKMTENIAAEPENVKWVMYRGELYSLLAQKFDVAFIKDVEVDFLRARDMSPGRPQIYLELAQARKMQGDSDKAWEYIDYIIRTVPNFSFGHLNALILAIETGNTIREAEEYKWLSEKGELRSEAIRDAYAKTQRYKDAVKIQEQIIHFMDEEQEAYPATYRAVFYAHLAALYQYAGDIEHARLAAYKVLELDPSKKNEVDAFLRSLP